MDIRGVERYIMMSTIKLKRDRSLKFNFLFLAFAYLLLAAIFFNFWFADYAFYDGEIISMTPFILVGALALTCMIFAVWFSKFKVKLATETLELAPGEFRANRSGAKKWVVIVVIIIWAVILFNWFSQQNPDTTAIVTFVVAMIIAPIFLFGAGNYFYMFYLLVRYCPYLRTAADERYYEPPEQEDTETLEQESAEPPEQEDTETPK